MLEQSGSARVYYDQDDNPKTLHQMVRDEPDWAASRITEGERAAEERDKLRAEVERLRNENQCCRDEIAHLREVKIAAVNVTECSSSQLPAFLEELDEALTASDADGGWWRSIPEVESLVEAVWQVLDDMGEDGQCCCLAAKHDLRRAYEPFDDGEESPPPAPPADTEGA